MKKNLLLVLLLLFIGQVATAQDFKSTWQTFGTITFAATTTGPVAYTWQTVAPAAPASGSGTFVGPLVTIAGLPEAVQVQLSIQPLNFKRIICNTNNDFQNAGIRSINQWGAVQWTSMEDAFRFTNLTVVNASDTPNLSGVTSLSQMFAITTINSPFNINAWNVSTITNLSGMFRRCEIFNQSLSNWNTSNVTNMSGMFEDARVFNLNLANWNTSNVTNMSRMFSNALGFNRPIGNWNTANVTNMSEMFGSLSPGFFIPAFNQNISNWITSSVTDMSGMFRGTQNFNQNISNWNTANVTNMSEMFQNAVTFNQNIGGWNTGNVTNMSGMFSGINFNNGEVMSFTNGGNLSMQNWNTANVTDMSRMFLNASNFNQNLGNWTLNAAVDLQEMLDSSGLNCGNYSKTLIGWNNNPNTPNNKILGATFMEYGPEAVAAVNNLIFNKAWAFSGHDFFSVTPQFNANNTYCEGASIPNLPTVSEEGISGVWSPPLNSSQTTTYTFVPAAAQCAVTSALTITINPFPIPTGDANQSFSTNSTIANIVVSPSSVLWYASAQDALSNSNPLPANTLLQNGFTYYAVNDNGECRSQPFPVTVSLNLSVGNNDFLSFNYFPNPVTSVLTISATNSIKNVEIYNLLGQLLINKIFDNATISIDLNKLPESIYIVKVKSENLSREFKIIKR